LADALRPFGLVESVVMTARIALSGRLLTARRSIGAAVLALAFMAGAPAGAADPIAVVLDQASVLRLPDRVSTIIVGNPLIADVSVQGGGLVVVTGKGYGSTNLIALDRAGVVLMERDIQVRGPNGSTIFVYRGVERESYSCTPNCERRITLGDSPGFFTATIGQTNIRDSQASGAGRPPQR
jgi:hypothetical protein